MDQFPRGRLPGYLSDCYSRDTSRTELYIVGSHDYANLAFEARSREFQAIIWVEDDVTGNGEIHDILLSPSNQAIIGALGAGLAIRGPGYPVTPEMCRLDKLRYAKIFVVTDDSAEGRKIKKGILKFMVRTSWPVIDAGHVFCSTYPISPDISPHEFVERVIDPETRQFVQYKLPS